LPRYELAGFGKEDAMVNVHQQAAEFFFLRPQAQTVEVIGDFNNWRRGELKLAKSKEGIWRGSLRLPPAISFRYVADGRCFIDFAAFGVAPGPFGFDSVVHIPGKTTRFHG
jgi:1,4-alpha-glucan branching enzyme